MPPGLADRKLGGDIYLLPVHDKNVNMFKKILEVTLPVVYDDKFFKSCANEWSDFCRILHFKDIPVGVIGGRLETDGSTKRLYITVISVLAAYRGRGLGAALLEEEMEALSKFPEVQEAYIHVHVKNEDALSFYTRHGFVKDPEVLKDYYAHNRGVEAPPDAWLLRKKVNVAKKE